MRTGEAVIPPATEPVETFPVRVSADGWVEIALTGCRLAPRRPMSLEALPFVNWIFWAALTAGTLLVVGVTELLGGTTQRLPAVHGLAARRLRGGPAALRARTSRRGRRWTPPRPASGGRWSWPSWR